MTDMETIIKGLDFIRRKYAFMTADELQNIACAIDALEAQESGVADLISRAAAIEAAIDGADDWDGGYNSERERCIREHMAKVPSVDAVPVVHGQWLGRRYDFNEYKHVIVPYDVTTFDNPDNLFCSVCNTPALSNGAENDVPSNYCPYCGAKMDGEDEPEYHGDGTRAEDEDWDGEDAIDEQRMAVKWNG